MSIKNKNLNLNLIPEYFKQGDWEEKMEVFSYWFWDNVLILNQRFYTNEYLALEVNSAIRENEKGYFYIMVLPIKHFK